MCAYFGVPIPQPDRCQRPQRLTYPDQPIVIPPTTPKTSSCRGIPAAWGSRSLWFLRQRLWASRYSTHRCAPAAAVTEQPTWGGAEGGSCGSPEVAADASEENANSGVRPASHQLGADGARPGLDQHKATAPTARPVATNKLGIGSPRPGIDQRVSPHRSDNPR